MAMISKTDAHAMSLECPFDFEWREALYALYALQHYEAISEKRDYPANVFYNQLFGILSGLRNSNRKTLLKHLDKPACIICAQPVELAASRLDHVIALSRGGKDSLENTLVLCRQHNSSKGAKDLLEWWSDKGYEPRDLPRNILCIYTRLMWQHLDYVFEQEDGDLPDFVRVFLTSRSENLPGDDHRLCLYGSTYAAIAFLGWEKVHGNNSEGVSGNNLC